MPTLLEYMTNTSRLIMHQLNTVSGRPPRIWSRRETDASKIDAVAAEKIKDFLLPNLWTNPIPQAEPKVLTRPTAMATAAGCPMDIFSMRDMA